MIDRRTFIGAVAGALFVSPPATALQAEKVARIGFLSLNSPEAARDPFAAFREGMRDCGWVEGQNVLIGGFSIIWPNFFLVDHKDCMRPICWHKFWGTSLRLIAPIVLVAGCTLLPTVAYQPYEGNANFFGSAGGTKLVVDGVDFWIYGTPPDPFSVLGIATSETGSGDSDDMGRAVVAGKVGRLGGSAAIQLTGNGSFSGVLRTASPAPVPAGRRQMKFAIVKYGPKN